MQREGIAVLTASVQDALLFFSGPLHGSLFLVQWAAKTADRAETEATRAPVFHVQPIWLRDAGAVPTRPKSPFKVSETLSRHKRLKAIRSGNSETGSEGEPLRAAKVAAARSPLGDGTRCLATGSWSQTTARGVTKKTWIVASAGEDKTVRIFRELAADKMEAPSPSRTVWRLAVEKTYPKRFTAVQMSLNGRFVLVADKFGDVYAIDTETEKTSLAPEWRYLAQAPLYAAPDGAAEPVMGHLAIITTLAIDPDGVLIGSADIEGQVRISAFPEVYKIEQVYSGCGGDPTWSRVGDYITKMAWLDHAETPTLIGGGTGLWFLARRRTAVSTKEESFHDPAWDIQGGRLPPCNLFQERADRLVVGTTSAAPNELLNRKHSTKIDDRPPRTLSSPWLCLDIDARTALALWGNVRHEVLFTRIPFNDCVEEVALQRLNRRLRDACARSGDRVPTAFCSFPAHLFETGIDINGARTIPRAGSACLVLVATAPDDDAGARATNSPAGSATREASEQRNTFFFVLPFSDSADASEEVTLWPLARACEESLNESIYACIRMHMHPRALHEHAETGYSAVKHSSWSWSSVCIAGSTTDPSWTWTSSPDDLQQKC
ncbi:hypothetical protein F1559_003284 [Cyanidiococcus yangmingshanensis]|uniref:Uncharacterized protein n=1 Tax=Cyanidiococcus yangmingshanensis TaxID=2690220 RepID=A0A7J7IM45_9RHOD|nr:hypothetical protein F1559_003284 [Cyanidiococcus yangmingshanensis]